MGLKSDIGLGGFLFAAITFNVKLSGNLTPYDLNNLVAAALGIAGIAVAIIRIRILLLKHRREQREARDEDA